MLEAEQLPAGISNLDTCLAHMDRDALPLIGKITTEREVYKIKVVSEKSNFNKCGLILKRFVYFSINFICVKCHRDSLLIAWSYSTKGTTKDTI